MSGNTEAALYRNNLDANGEQAAEAFTNWLLQYFNDGKLNAAGNFAKRLFARFGIKIRSIFIAIIKRWAPSRWRWGIRRPPSISGMPWIRKRGASKFNYQQWVEALWLSGSLSAAIDAASTFLEWSKGEQTPRLCSTPAHNWAACSSKTAR